MQTGIAAVVKLTNEHLLRTLWAMTWVWLINNRQPVNNNNANNYTPMIPSTQSLSNRCYSIKKQYVGINETKQKKDNQILTPW